MNHLTMETLLKSSKKTNLQVRSLGMSLAVEAQLASLPVHYMQLSCFSPLNANMLELLTIGIAQFLNLTA